MSSLLLFVFLVSCRIFSSHANEWNCASTSGEFELKHDCALSSTIIVSGALSIEGEILVNKKYVSINGTGRKENYVQFVADGFRLFKVDSNGNLTLSNVALRGGRVYSRSSTNSGGSALFVLGGNAELMNCMIVNNWACPESNGYYGSILGGAIRITEGFLKIKSSTIRESRISHGRSYTRGGGVYQSGGLLILELCKVEDNYVGRAGGGMYIAGGETVIKDSLFKNNHAAGRWDMGSNEPYGGGIYVESGDVVVISSTFHQPPPPWTYQNTNPKGNAYYRAGGNLLIINSVINGTTHGLISMCTESYDLCLDNSFNKDSCSNRINPSMGVTCTPSSSAPTTTRA